MPVLQVSAATLSALVVGNPPETSLKLLDSAGKNAGAATDQFSSLLNVVGNIEDTDNSPKSTIKPDNIKEILPKKDDVPASQRSVAKNENADKLQADNSHKPKPQAKDDNEDNVVVRQVSVRKQVEIIRKVDRAEVTTSGSGDAQDVPSTQELAEKISQHVDNLAMLLHMLTQLLAGAGVVQAQIKVETKLSIQISQTDFVIGGGSKVQNPLVVFADLKDMLAKLQQFLQGVNGQNTPLSDSQIATIASINEALAGDLDVLKSLLPQTSNPQDRASLFSSLLDAQKDIVQPEAQLKLEDVKSLLDDDISLIREALQKFSGNKITEANSAKQQSDNVINIASGQGKVETLPTISPVEIATNIPKTEQQNNQQSLLQNNPNSLLTAVAVQATSSNSNTDTNSGGGFSQNNNSGQQFSVGGLNNAARATNSSAASAQFSSLLNRAQQMPVTEQVVFHIKSAVGSGNSKITIQLNPEELGKLDITLDVDSKGKTGVTITADNKQTLDMLQRDSQGLQKALSDAGLKADAGSLSFNLRGGEREGQGQNQSYAASNYQKSQPEELAQEETSIASLAAVTRSYTVKLQDGLNIRV